MAMLNQFQFYTKNLNQVLDEITRVTEAVYYFHVYIDRNSARGALVVMNVMNDPAYWADKLKNYTEDLPDWPSRRLSPLTA